MTDAVFDEIPAYARLASPGQREAVRAHSREHVRVVIQTVRTWTLPPIAELGFVRERAALRASQQLPLSALLHSYRLGHRAVWQRLVRILADLDAGIDAALSLSTLTLSYTELISVALAEGYVDHQRGTLMQLDRGRRDLLDHI